MPMLWPDIAWELIWELNKTIFVGEAVRLTDLPAGSWSGSGHLNRCHEAVDASPHPNGSVTASHFDLNINWGGLPGDTKGAELRCSSSRTAATAPERAARLADC